MVDIMKANILKIKNKDKVHLDGVMERFMKENGLMENSMVMAKLYILQV
jgi:hypothetical protein